MLRPLAGTARGRSRAWRGSTAFRHDLGEAQRSLDALTGTLDLPATVIVVLRAPGESDVAARCSAVLPAARTTRIEDAGRYLVRSHPAAAAGLVTATLAAPAEGGTR
ncbi:MULTISPECIES: hypothetical protein [unclassified Streptomyces]|uniref:hypothetical protein n=1 Tax=unclassified Streptomyces TaxID=2593676 RepID=UPI0035E2D0D5